MTPENPRDEVYAQSEEEIENKRTPAGERITSDEKVSAKTRVWQIVFGLFSFIALAWAFLQVSYFWRANQGIFPSLTENPQAPSGVFSGLFRGTWSFNTEHINFIQFGQSSIVILMTIALGMLVVRALDVFPTRRSNIAMGLIVGLGVSTWFFQLLIMFNLLYLVTSWILWIALLFIGAMLYRYREVEVLWRSWSSKEKPNPYYLPYFDHREKVDRTRVDPTGPRLELRYPESFVRWVIGTVFLLLCAVICSVTFWHAAFFPETYWDSLILYLGYARMTFMEHGFPIKVTGQVGIGLGANYPHMFSNYGAMVSTMFGEWSDLHQRLLPPLLQIASAVLIYDIILMVTGRRFAACAGVLMFLSVPYGIVYYTFASNYCLALAVTAAFLYAGCILARSQTPGAFALFTFMPAMGMNINYLMGILWVPWLIMVFVCFLKMNKAHAHITSMEEIPADADQLAKDQFAPIDVTEGDQLDDEELSEFEAAYSSEVFAYRPPTPLGLLRKKTFWWITIICIVIGSTWYARNFVVTGNPVYAFFHELFPGTKNLNPEVMESAQLEWFANGDGINQAALIFTRDRFEKQGLDPDSATALDASLGDRLNAFHLFFQGFDIRRLDESTNELQQGRWSDRLYYLSLIRTPEPPQFEDQLPRLSDPYATPRNPQAYKLQPLFLGFFFPGVFVGLLIAFFPKAALVSGLQPIHRKCFLVVLIGSLTVMACLFGYHFLLSDMYLYQIIPILIPMGVVGAFTFWTLGSILLKDKSIPVLLVLLLWTGIVMMSAFVPGIGMALRNFKVSGINSVGGELYDPGRLDIFRNPGLDPDIVYRLQYGDDVTMWNFINNRYESTQSKELLTHDNRHLMYDPEIRLVHLDDWSIQQIWEKPLEEKIEYLEERGIPYYLRIPNESKHPILEKLGIDEMIEKGYLREVFSVGDNELYEFVYEFEEGSMHDATMEELESQIEVVP